MQARHVSLRRLGVVGDGPVRDPDGGGLPGLHPRKGLYGALVYDSFHGLLSRIAIKYAIGNIAYSNIIYRRTGTPPRTELEKAETRAKALG